MSSIESMHALQAIKGVRIIGAKGSPEVNFAAHQQIVSQVFIAKQEYAVSLSQL